MASCTVKEMVTVDILGCAEATSHHNCKAESLAQDARALLKAGCRPRQDWLGDRHLASSWQGRGVGKAQNETFPVGNWRRCRAENKYVSRHSATMRSPMILIGAPPAKRDDKDKTRAHARTGTRKRPHDDAGGDVDDKTKKEQKSNSNSNNTTKPTTTTTTMTTTTTTTTAATNSY